MGYLKMENQPQTVTHFLKFPTNEIQRLVKLGRVMVLKGFKPNNTVSSIMKFIIHVNIARLSEAALRVGGGCKSSQNCNIAA